MAVTTHIFDGIWKSQLFALKCQGFDLNQSKILLSTFKTQFSDEKSGLGVYLLLK